MRHTGPLCVIALLLTVEVAFSSSRASFLFVHIVKGIPYAIIDQPKEVNVVERALLFSQLNDSINRNKESIMLDAIYSVSLTDVAHYLFWNPEAPRKWGEIKGADDAMLATVGFKKGDRLMIQSVTADGSGEQHEIEVDKVLYYADEYSSLLLLRCKPVSFHRDSDNMCRPISLWRDRSEYRTYCPYVAYSAEYTSGRWPEWIPQSQISATMSPLVREQVDKLSKEFFRADSIIKYPFVTLQAFRYFHDMQGYLCFALACSRGGVDDKETWGTTWIIDNQGKILQHLDDFNCVLGVTDADRNGTHEVILMWGNSYGGGVRAIYFGRDRNDKRELRFGPKAATMFD